nr:MAG TPA: hypothetical protein [Caudoviricetes sp.]
MHRNIKPIKKAEILKRRGFRPFLYLKKIYASFCNKMDKNAHFFGRKLAGNYQI